MDYTHTRTHARTRIVYRNVERVAIGRTRGQRRKSINDKKHRSNRKNKNPESGKMKLFYGRRFWNLFLMDVLGSGL